MKILITGGSGFIGSNLAERLVMSKDTEVFILDWKLRELNLKKILKKIHFIKADIREFNLKKILDDYSIDGVIHLAAVSRVIWGEQNPDLCISINVNGTKTLLDAILKSVKKPWIIFGSSREVYGEPKKLPVMEKHPKIPINIYGRSKLAGEALVKKYAQLHNLQAVVLRFSNVYGNEKDILDRVIPRFVLAALKEKKIEIHGGRQMFDFTYIDDTINGILKTIELLSEMNKEHPFFDDFHLLPGEPTTLQEVVEIISRHLDKDLDVIYTPPRKYDVEKFYGDPSKAENILGFKAKTLIRKGLPIMIDWFKEVFQ